MSLLGYIYIYLLGGITFIPIVIFLFIYLHPLVDEASDEIDEGEKKVNVGEIEEKESTGLKTYRSGWITVTQDYIESIEDISSNTQSISESAENKSAYSSLYKLVKNSDTESSSTVETSNIPIEGKSDTTVKKSQKKHRFYAVLKHGNLFLYKNESLKDVKHVIVLSNQVVSVWPRDIPDGQLFTKATAICIMKRDWSRKRRMSEEFENEMITTSDILTMNLQPPSGSIFVYCDTNIEKEDWYFSLVKATKTESESKNLNPLVYAKTLHFETDDMISLIQTLYSSEGQWQTKWLNAMIGRLFLSLQKTEFLREFLKNRLNKKLNKIKKPGFLDTFKLVKLDAGVAAPFITWPSLREINPNGDLVVKLFFHYHGKLSFQISTKVNINLGSRFKPREVDLLLSITIEKLEGPMLVKFKPPPSERIWYSFEGEPLINLKIEPIISSRQLTYNIITNSIEKKLKEAIKDSLVLPHWDDFVFYNTTNEIYRGGIWDKDIRPNKRVDKNESLDIEESQQQSEEDADSIIEGSNLPKQTTSSSLAVNKTGDIVPPVKSNTTISKLRISNTLNDISKKMKKQKSNTTLGVNEDNYYSDGSFVESSKTIDHDLSDPTNNKKSTINTLKKIGKWYFKDEKSIPENENYTPPEMILSRRAVKKSGLDTSKFLQNSDLPSYEMFNKDLNYDNTSKEAYNQINSTGRSRGNSKLSLSSTEKLLSLNNDHEGVINGSVENQPIGLNIDIDDSDNLNLKDDSKVALSSAFSPTNVSILSESLTEEHHLPHQRHRKPPPEPVPKTPPQLPPREINGIIEDISRLLNTSQGNKVNVINEAQEVKKGELENRSNENDNDIDDLSI
ncbi:putative integral membrane protein conserved domain-containing protein [Debaryomyces fabryi]|uniref:Putative integral membrane protein conserved domain-containing protein n=1 Tax=Debaryomyces fabryi TaxID=58627 RepID=A0A0V1PUL2_9ASCO|nr:putative integral membrane protein conserved domain-containing protein [Debaryomyces fabryi]KRZ99678.1 putative integral membrane protein conserved domain-containing protein [Debaryomyces fabryi]CUM45860.1 unnamed protein product [Debaryomyces fabryi]